jgi:hypothetical protein
MKPEEIERRFAKGDTIVERGSPERTLYVVRGGSVLIHVNEGQAPYLLGPGDVFGEVASILGRPSSFRAEAEGDTTVLAVDVSLLNSLIRERRVRVPLIQVLAERIGHAREEGRRGVRSSPSRRAGEPGARWPRSPARSSPPDSGEVPTPVSGKLMDLAAAAKLRSAGVPVCRSCSIAARGPGRRQLTVLEPDELASVAHRV